MPSLLVTLRFGDYNIGSVVEQANMVPAPSALWVCNPDRELYHNVPDDVVSHCTTCSLQMTAQFLIYYVKNADSKITKVGTK